MEENDYSVHFTKLAMNDLDDIFRYISEKLFAEGSATRLLDRLESSIMQLKEFPKLGNRLTDEYLRIKGYRRVIVDSYIIFYIVSDERKEVIIMRVLYGKRQYEDLL
ncbi:MAG TPA: type II toxin-antitoxin system RelE/ParE family toxin [Candidatus Dormibacteraeota bacterium]|nr:type II toxin-antitoxin system RelE/ParE family toxin [Candidatus Dormibacteraeota bacterium]